MSTPPPAESSQATPASADLAALSLENQALRKEADERREFARLLQRRVGFLNRILESVPFPLYVIDTHDYSIQIANSAAKMGRLAANITCHALTHGSAEPCSEEGHGCPLRAVVRTKGPVVAHHVHLDDEGRPRDVEVHAFPLLDDDGEVTQMLEFVLDITDRRRAERERDRLAAQLKTAEAAD